jgi:hypothetical protein
VKGRSPAALAAILALAMPGLARANTVPHWQVNGLPLTEGTPRPLVESGSLTLESTAGSVMCETSAAADIENPVGGGAGTASVKSFETHGCASTACPGSADVTAEGLPWNRQLVNGPKAQSTETLRWKCTDATGETLFNASFSGELRPNQVNGTSALHPSGEEYASEPLGSGKFTGFERYLGQNAQELITVHDDEVLIPKEPAGPPPPAGGWKLVYGDAFHAPIGTAAGQDNTWAFNESDEGFTNPTELEVFRPARVTITSEGLRLSCLHVTSEIDKTGKYYECGALKGAVCDPGGCLITSAEPTGYNTPTIRLGEGQTMAFQFRGKFPPNSGTANPAWWMDGPPFEGTEFDMFEGWGYNPACTAQWTTCRGTFGAWFAPPHTTLEKWGFSPDPSETEHTYTVEIFPGSSSGKYRYQSWMDGELLTLHNGEESTETNISPEITPVTPERLDLQLSYALRASEGLEPGFSTGENSELVRYVGVYEDRDHAERGVGIEHGGLARGTGEAPQQREIRPKHLKKKRKEQRGGRRKRGSNPKHRRAVKQRGSGLERRS